MNFKKIMSTALAGVMALSLSVPALAAANTETSLTQNTEVTGSTEAPTIKITVPATNTVIVNPYKMTVQNAAGDDVTDQIVSATKYIKNESDVALKVSAEVTGKPAGALTLATASTQGGTRAVTTNSVFMSFEIGAATAEDGTGDPTWAANGYDSKLASQILVSAKAVKKADMLTLGVGETTATYAGYRLTGDAADTPTNAWTENDKVDVSIAFTFTPTVAATPAP